MKTSTVRQQSASFLLALAAILPGQAGPANAAAALNQRVDPAVVEQKIQALGVRDDTLPYDEQPATWLTQRGEQVYPQLIAALDSPRLVVASNCLEILAALPPRPALVDALMRIASDMKHPLSREATLDLCRSAADPRTRRIFEAALSDTRRFPDPEQRARFAEALGSKDKAVELLVQCLDRQYYFEIKPIIERLVKLGQPAAIRPLERKAEAQRWEIAGAAYLGLAQLDPQRHALTAAQKDFLENTRRGGKADARFYAERQHKLAVLPRGQVRPFALQMLHTEDAAEDAAGILRLWKDREALPEIRRLWTEAKNWQAGGFLAAYLEIEGTDASLEEALKLLKNQDQSSREEWVHGLVRTEMSPPRKVAFLRRVQDALGSQDPTLVPRSLNWERGDLARVLVPLMETETNLQTLAGFAAQVPPGTNHLYDPALARAAKLVNNQTKVALRDPATAQAAATILNVCEDHHIPSGQPVTETLLASPDTAVRISAARKSARTGGQRQQALALLNQELGNAEAQYREQAAQALLDLPCQKDAERLQRESAALAQFGRPAEDYALRVLITCAGPKTAAVLSPVLEGDDVPRAIYAAWVLAQHPDKEVALKALRRVGLYSMFHHHMYQAGSGIDFPIAPNLSFHQTISRFNPQFYPDEDPRRLIIPPELILPRRLDQAEQTFLVRVYLHTISEGPQPLILAQGFDGPGLERLTDTSYLSFLRVAAREDPSLTALHVRGSKVAHLPNRKTAAEIIARLTEKPASYLGLAGEQLDSAAVPAKPYPTQNELIARLELDRIAAARFTKPPQTDREWSRTGAYDEILRNLVDEEQFGSGLKEQLLSEARRRAASETLRNAGFSFWR